MFRVSHHTLFCMAAAAVVACAHGEPATDIYACNYTYTTGAQSCADLRAYSNCVDAVLVEFPGLNGTVGHGNLMTEMAQRRDCAPSVDATDKPKISSKAGDLELQVFQDNDVFATRVGPEGSTSVSVFQTRADLDALASDVLVSLGRLDGIDGDISEIGKVTSGLQSGLQSSISTVWQRLNDNDKRAQAVDNEIGMLQGKIKTLSARLDNQEEQLTSLKSMQNDILQYISTFKSKILSLERFALAPAKVGLDNYVAPCTISNKGTLRLRSTGIEFCTGSKWKPVATEALGSSPTAAARSCKDIRAAGIGASGPYWLITKSGSPYEGYCDMNTDGGGWTLVTKVNNGDAKHFYGTSHNSPFQTGAVLNTVSCRSKAHADAQCTSYNNVPGAELMVYDGLNNKRVAGTFTPFTSLHSKMLMYRTGGRVHGSYGCSENAQNIQGMGTTVCGVTVQYFGIKCEDDKSQTWICDDDATYIGWHSVNSWHRQGLSKCGTDGGDDVYNSENTQRMQSGFAMVFVR